MTDILDVEVLLSNFEGRDRVSLREFMGYASMSLEENATREGAGLLPDRESRVEEKELKNMMSDPRYWRDRDPAFVERVRNGFKALYPEGVA